jgi:hypothetical protein
MLTFSQTTQLVKLRKLAEEQGREDVLAKVDNLLQQGTPEDTMSREGRIYEEEAREEQSEYNTLKQQQEQIENLLSAAQEAGRDDVVEKARKVQSLINKEVYDFEDITEEIRGAGAATLESLSGGLLGDEAQAWAISGLTGADYDIILEDTRRVQQEFAEDHPAIDLGIRIATGVLPSAMLAKTVGVGSTFVGGALRQGGLATGEIGLYSFMEGEGGVEQRLENVAKTFQDPLALGAVGLAGGLGGIAGRGVGRMEAIERSVAEAIEQEEKNIARLRTSAEEGIGTEVVESAQIYGDQAVLRFYNQNGRMPQGTEITQVYQEVADSIGVPIGRVMQAEMKAGKKRLDLDYRDKDIADIRKRAKVSGGEEGFVTERQARESRGVFRDFYEDKLEPIVEVAKRRVSKAAGGNFQRMATNMARQQQAVDQVLTSDTVTAFSRRLETDSSGQIKQKILNFSNSDLESSVRRKEFNDLKKMLSDEEMQGVRDLLRLRVQQANEYRKHVYDALPIDPLYLPSQTLSQTNLAQAFNRRGMPKNAVDENMKRRTRGYLTEAEAREYENPLIVLRDKLANDEALIQLHRNFGLENIVNRIRSKPEQARQIQKEVEEGSASFKQLREALRQEGANEGAVQTADELARSLIVRGTQGPSGFISNIRKAAYMGTIGNPYSALLNFGDVSNTVVNFGADNTASGIVNYLKKNGLSVNVGDVGLANQATGEFLREGSTKWNRRFNKMSDATFKASGFRGADIAGKTITLNAAVQRGKQMAADGTLAREYGWLFNGAELSKLRKDLLQGNKTDRVREFAAAELAKLQPSDLAQMPKWYLDNPNGRILYMLRTFGLKQLQQVNRLVLETWKEGVKRNDDKLKAEAIKNAAAYLVIVGGGNTLLNELRQPIKGKREAFELDEMQKYFIDYMLGLASVNTLSTYNLKRASEGDAKDLIMALFPAPLNMAEDFAADAIQLASGEEDLDDIFFEGDAVQWLPFMRIAQPYLEETFD